MKICGKKEKKDGKCLKSVKKKVNDFTLQI